MAREIRIHDTLTGDERPLETREPGRVGIYACGPTVYAPVHVGNARPYVVFTQLKRFLEHEGHQVTLVANVTDVNDKIYDAAREAGRPSEELAGEMTARYEEDTDRLGLGRPEPGPKASGTIAAIGGLIQALIDSGHAYAANGDVYFRVASFDGYGKLSNRALEDMDQGEENALKEDPHDFALWKAQKPEEDTAWDAPWGRGRPGWHIECSAMAEQILGLDFEIHGGGRDLVFPHHENEIAQTEAARGEPPHRRRRAGWTRPAARDALRARTREPARRRRRAGAPGGRGAARRARGGAPLARLRHRRPQARRAVRARLGGARHAGRPDARPPRALTDDRLRP